MKKICIVGAGTAGTVLALELNEITNHEIILLDNDKITDSFNNNLDLKKNFHNNYKNYKTTGYGFGGSSNLWHGVLTDLDDEDYLYINNTIKKNIKNEFKKYYKQIEKYFGKINFTNKIINQKNELENYLNFSKFVKKKYTVQRSPTRFRKLLKKRLKKPNNNLKIIENAIAIKLIKNNQNEIIKLIYVKNNQEHNIFADYFIISMGGLESPRLLLQSFENNGSLNKLIGKGLMDHPFAIIGKLSIKKNIIFKQIGNSNFLSNNSERIGYRVEKELRSSGLNHSLFIRPGMTKNIEKLRHNLKLLLYEKFSLKIFFSIFFNIDAIKLALTLLSEKMGFGYISKNFLVTMQLEQNSNQTSRVKLSKNYDEYNRRIPEIHEKISEELIKDIKNIQTHFSKIVINDCKFEKFNVSKNDLIPGAHYSGTCRMGIKKKNSVVDGDLKYHGIKNLYVCDSSIFPKIGNANLVFTISAFSIRLANYLKKLIKNK